MNSIVKPGNIRKSMIKLSVQRQEDDKVFIVIADKYRVETRYLDDFILTSLAENMEGLYEIEEIVPSARRVDINE